MARFSKCILTPKELTLIKEKCPCYTISRNGDLVTITDVTTEYFITKHSFFRVSNDFELYRKASQAVVGYHRNKNTKQSVKDYLFNKYPEYFI